MIFPTGTHASMRMPDGSSQPLDHLTVRQTEYTVGDSGPSAMPADLPKTSSYTYAAEFSVDEATQAGAAGVDFDQPVASYTDNFVGFPVGDVVPSGWYNRAKAAWEPSANGRVVKVLSEDGGIAQLDVLGKGQPATAAQLAQLGVTDSEMRKVADLYDPGKTLWRVPLRHFSTST